MADRLLQDNPATIGGNALMKETKPLRTRNAREGQLEVDRNEFLVLVKQNPRSSTRELAALIHCSQTTVVEILHELNFRNMLGQWVPHRLTPDQMEQRVTICHSNLTHLAVNNYLRQIITGDEKWVLYVNHTRKRQWVPPNEEPEPDPKSDPHERKVMITVFWDYAGIIYWELLPLNTTVTAAVYCHQLDNLHRALNNVRPRWAEERGKVRLLHDNARSHVAKVTREKLAKFRWQVMAHPPYSPDLSPTDYQLFRELARFLKEKQFDDCGQVRCEVTNFFRSLPPQFFEEGIMDLPRRWETVIDNDGRYILK